MVKRYLLFTALIYACILHMTPHIYAFGPKPAPTTIVLGPDQFAGGLKLNNGDTVKKTIRTKLPNGMLSVLIETQDILSDASKAPSTPKENPEQKDTTK